MLHHIKPAVNSILRPVTRALIRSRVHANTLTFAGLLTSAAAAWIFATGPVAWAGFLVLLAGLFDLLDGAVARESGRVSRYGAYLDSTVDRYAEIVVFIGLLVRFQGDLLTQIAVLLATGGSLMVSYTRARAEGLGEEVRGGLMQRPERVVLMALGSFFGLAGLQVVVWILAVLTNITSVQRMVFVVRTLVAADGGTAGAPAGDGVQAGDADGSRRPDAAAPIRGSRESEAVGSGLRGP